MNKNIDLIHISENLSKNLVCNWSLHKSKKSIKKHNLISVTYFEKESLTNANKKKRYFEGLKYIFKTMRLKLNHYILRIYHDASVNDKLYSFYHSLKDEDKDFIEFYQYDIPYLYEKKNNNKYHKGTTGTLWRFLPFFDNEIHSKNVDIKVVLDIDNDRNNYNFIDLTKKIEKNKNVECAYRTHPYYYNTPRVTCFNVNNQKKPLDSFYYIVAHYIYQKKVIPYKLMETFLDKYIYNISNENKDYMEKVCYPEEYKNGKKELQFGYGVDELFMNGVYLRYVHQENMEIMYIYYLTNFDYFKTIYYTYSEIKECYEKKNSIEEEKVNEFSKELFEKMNIMEIFRKNKIYEKNKFDIKKLSIFMTKEGGNSEKIYYKIRNEFFSRNIGKKKYIEILKKYLPFNFFSNNFKQFLYLLSINKNNYFLLLSRKKNDFKYDYQKIPKSIF